MGQQLINWARLVVIVATVAGIAVLSAIGEANYVLLVLFVGGSVSALLNHFRVQPDGGPFLASPRFDFLVAGLIFIGSGVMGVALIVLRPGEDPVIGLLLGVAGIAVAVGGLTKLIRYWPEIDDPDPS